MIRIQTGELEKALTALNQLPCSPLLSTWKIICGMYFYLSLTKKKKKAEYQAKEHDPFFFQASSKPYMLGYEWGSDTKEAHIRTQYSSCH